MAHATTAPVRDELVRRGTPIERVRSRGTEPSPGNSQLALREAPHSQPLTHRYSQLRGQPRDLRGSTDEDYVIVDKQAVQVNAFADELASARRGRNTPPINPTSTTLVRRLSKTGSQPSSPRSPRPNSSHRPTSSYERRYGASSPTSNKSTLAKALELANIRIFGFSVSPPNPSPPERIAYPSSSLICLSPALSEPDHLAVTKIEESASRSDVVYVFAEVKYAQLLPTTPPTGLGLLTPDAEEHSSSLELTPDATVHAAEECLVLFVKTLSLLSHATTAANTWWSTLNPRDPMSPSRTAACTRMNNVVQWMRERFNDVLEKAEIVQNRIKQAQQALPESHPWHPVNHLASSSSEDLVLTTGVSAEKLMYDRALEMSRASAVNELVGEDLQGCEGAYVTALRLLEGVLEGEEMEEQDRGVIENCKFPFPSLQITFFC